MRAGPPTLQGMCRNIRTLHNFKPPASEDEVRSAALQYVRKVSGSTKPSRANAEAFDRAVEVGPQVLQVLLEVSERERHGRIVPLRRLQRRTLGSTHV